MDVLRETDSNALRRLQHIQWHLDSNHSSTIRDGLLFVATTSDESSTPTPRRATQEIFALYARNGTTNYIGEEISQIAHGCQAARWATEAGYDQDVSLAALFHDVGHLLEDLPQMDGGLGVGDHEKVGARYLRSLGFSAKTCALVERHVDAKRYLCWKDPSYLGRLSEASFGTLKQQGGPMSESEAREFESNDPLFQTIIDMRKWDEKAKAVNPSYYVKGLNEYTHDVMHSLTLEKSRKRVLNKTFTHYTLSAQQKTQWEREGFLRLTDAFSHETKMNLVQWCNDVQRWAPEKGKHMVYYESDTRTGKKMLCRTENILPYHSGLKRILTDGVIADVLEQVFGERGVLFKEKINYKLPGGGAFPAHQDMKAFTTFGQSSHVTVNIAIDEANVENGCLEVAPGKHLQGEFEIDPTHGGLTRSAENQIDNWMHVPLNPGDVLLFNSWLPHPSAANHSTTDRKALHVTYTD